MESTGSSLFMPSGRGRSAGDADTDPGNPGFVNENNVRNSSFKIIYDNENGCFEIAYNQKNEYFKIAYNNENGCFKNVCISENEIFRRKNNLSEKWKSAESMGLIGDLELLILLLKMGFSEK